MSIPRILVGDIEGTLTDKSGRNTSLALLRRLRALERREVTVAFCSGRGVHYQRALRKKWKLTGDGPLVAENGCSIYIEGRELPSYNICDFDRSAIISRLLKKGVSKLSEFDPDKTHAVTVYPKGFLSGADYTADDIQRIYRFLSRSLEEIPCAIFYTSASGEVLPKGVDKAVGLRLLLKRMGARVADVLYMGDGQNDLPAARYVVDGGGRVGVPANSVSGLKAIASYVARNECFRGAGEIIDHFFPRGKTARIPRKQ